MKTQLFEFRIEKEFRVAIGEKGDRRDFIVKYFSDLLSSQDVFKEDKKEIAEKQKKSLLIREACVERSEIKLCKFPRFFAMSLR